MGRKWKLLCAIMPLMLAGCSAAIAQDSAPIKITQPAEQAHNLPGWMMGAWVEQKGDTWTEEFWTHPRGGIMLGAGRTGKGDKLQIWEQTQIRPGKDGKLSFFAMPRGAPPSEFPILAQTADSITFANPAHDYPQRIHYWREGKLLRAEISLIDGSNASGWTYQPMGGGK